MGLKEFFKPYAAEQPDEQRSGESTLENPSIDLMTALGAVWGEGLRNVTPDKSLGIVSIFSAVRILSEAVASLPLHVYRKEGKDRIRVSADQDPRARLLDDKPNPDLDAYPFWNHIMSQLLLWGNAYCWRDVNGRNGMTEALWPLSAQSTTLKRTASGRIAYEVQTDKGLQLLPGDEVCHFRAFNYSNPLVGMSPITLARQSLSITLSAEEYAQRFYDGDTATGSVIELDNVLSDKQYHDAMAKWKAGSKSFRILDGGAKLKTVSMSNEDAQFLQSRTFSVLEVARMFRVPPYLLGHTEGGSSYASIEQQSIDFLTYSLRPWLTLLEQGINNTVFGNEVDQEMGLFSEFKTAALLRGDTTSRYQAYAVGLQNGWLSRNEVRELENMGLIPDGDQYLEGVPGSKPTEPEAEPTNEEEDND